ncbi:MAG TPA: DUF1638 domain-containing protein [Anaerolineales bacterium]|nr:DUF1638 domain-containing protein [Anaerolineales bacterium]
MDNLPSPNHSTPPCDARRMVFACATVIEEMLPFLPGDVPYEVLDFGLHLHPTSLRESLQEKIEQLSPRADVLLLGYGLCSMAVVGIQATTATLVIPRTDDCIGIFLGSCAAYREQFNREPGTYYLTKGWIEVGDSPFEEHKRLVEKYGEAKADRMTRLVLKNYKRLGFINTGRQEIERYRAYAQKAAARFDLRFEELEGSSALVKKLVLGPWDEEFVVVPPDGTVRYEDFTLSITGQGQV